MCERIRGNSTVRQINGILRCEKLKSTVIGFWRWMPTPGARHDAKVVRLFTTALLPERLRDAYGLDWGLEKQARFAERVRSVVGLRGSGPGAAALDGKSDAR